jgi:hypothetical protein
MPTLLALIGDSTNEQQTSNKREETTKAADGAWEPCAPNTKSCRPRSSPSSASELLEKLDLDGIDASRIWFGDDDLADWPEDRVLYFWRDGYSTGPLPAPFGRMDVAAVKVGRIKLWFSTKSAHYNDDVEVDHDPPLLFDMVDDPAEAHPLDPTQYTNLIDKVKEFVQHHKDSIDWGLPLALASDPQYLPCVDRATDCRTTTTYHSSTDPQLQVENEGTIS